jgi:uncharacterized protein YbaR (Trm112 family)
MVDPDLLSILVCPENKTSLELVEGETIERLNALRESGELKNRSGHDIEEAFEAGLLREDGKYLYMIQQDIPIMLIDEAIPMEGLAL